MNKVIVAGMQLLLVGLNGFIAGTNLAQGNQSIAYLNLLLVALWIFLGVMNVYSLASQVASKATEDKDQPVQ